MRRCVTALFLVAVATGHARAHPLVAKAHRMQNVEVLVKPVELEQLRRLLEDSSP